MSPAMSPILSTVAFRILAPLAIAGLAFVAGETWAMRTGVPAYGIDETILDAQADRAARRLDADVLLTGDSSGLVGVDAPRLARLMGGSVQSLSTMGNVGPAGWGALVGRARAAGTRPRVVVVLVHGGVLGHELRGNEFEQAALGGAWPPQRFGANLRRRLKLALGEFGRYPMPGPWGRMYGDAEGLRRAVQSGQGTVTDPSSSVRCPSAGFTFGISEPIAARLQTLRRELAALAPARALVGLTPLPAGCAGAATEPSREETLRRLAAAIGAAPTDVLALPATLPDDQFAGFTHLNAAGRGRFTVLLADGLRRALAPDETVRR